MSAVTCQSYLSCSDERTLVIQGKVFATRLLATKIKALDDVLLDEFFPEERRRLVPRIFGGQVPVHVNVYLSQYAWALGSFKPIARQAQELLLMAKRPTFSPLDRIEKVYQLIARSESELIDRVETYCQRKFTYPCEFKIALFIQESHDFVSQFGLELGTQLSHEDLVAVRQEKGFTARELKTIIDSHR